MTGLFAWPSVMIFVGNLAFAAFLVPTLLGPAKPHIATAGFTALLLWVFVAANWGLGATLGAIGAIVDAAAWSWLAGQCAVRDRRPG